MHADPREKGAQNGAAAMEPDSWFVSFLASAFFTFVSVVVVDRAFLEYAHQFEAWRQPHVEFAFSVPVTSQMISAIICFLASMKAMQSRTWILPVGVSFLLVLVATPPISWSGPDAVNPLVDYQMELGLRTWLVDSILIVIWVCARMNSARMLPGREA